MDKKPLIGVSILAVVLLVLGSSVPAVARTQSSLPKTMPPISPSSAENYEVYIGAGIIRKYEGKFGLGWHMIVKNTGDTTITGAMYDKTTTLFGEVISYQYGPFSIPPGVEIGSGGCMLLDFHPINHIDLTVVVENMTYSRSGYEIGPFVLLVG
jgi:hypothetical protein